MLDTWQYSFSDDYSLTAMIERSRRQIVFLPECFTPSYVQTDFAGLLEFTESPDAYHSRVPSHKCGLLRLPRTLPVLSAIAMGFVLASESHSGLSAGISSASFWCFRCFSPQSGEQFV